MENLTPVRPASIIGNSRLREIKTIKGVAKDLVKQKTQNFELEKKFFKIQKDTIARNKLRDKERLQEAKKPRRKAGFIREEIKDKSIKIYDLFKFFVGYKVLQWMSRKENVEAIGEIAKAMKNIFKIIDHLAGIGVEGVLGGLHSVLFGSNFLERFFGIFKLIGGFFIIRRLLFPGKILKDITWILKNRKSIGNVFKALGSGKLKEALGRLFKLLTPNLYVAYTRGLTAGVKRVILKVFGKNPLKILTKVASKIGFRSAKEFVKNTAKNIAKPLTRIPFIGPILGFGLNLIFGDPLDKAAVKAIGAGIGAWLGGIVMGALGSIVPVAGTAAGAGLGAFVGGFIGDWVGDKLYGFFKGFTAPKEPALAVGGIVTKPTRALIGEAGPEAVIPLPKIYDGTILNAPMGIVASSMIGGIDAVISSLGPVGLTIRPYASSLLAPYRREFGSTNYVFTSNIGGKTAPLTTKLPEQNDNEEVAKILGLNKTVNLIKKKESAEEAKKARYNSGNSVREILGDILNNIINLDFDKKTTPKSKTTTGDVDKNALDASGVPGADHQEKAFNYFVKLGLSKEHAAGIVGNLMIESYTDIKPNADNGTHRGIAQWDKQDRWPRLVAWANNKNKDPNKFETQLEYLSIESGYLRKYKSISVSNVDDATREWEELFERSGGQALDTRKKYARSVLQKYAKMQTGGIVQTPGVADTGPGYAIQGATDQQGRPVVFSKSAASAFAKMMKDSGGVVKASDVASSKRSPTKNAAVGGASRSKHMYGIAMDIHGSSEKWIRKNGSKYGWIANDYPGSHGGHFEFGGEGIKPSDISPDSQENSTTDTGSDSSPAEFTAEMGAKAAEQLGKLFQMLTGTPKTNGAQLQKDSMDYVQSFKDFKPNPDTYIMMGGNNIISSTTLVTPIDQPDYSSRSFSNIDSATAFKLNARL